MYLHRVCIAIIVALVLALSYVEAGPARSLALAAAQRASKIPRSIRAPFRNTEMMTARGFGKRGQYLSNPLKMHNANSNDVSWNYGKRETKMFDDVNDVNENIQQIFSEQGVESIPVEWLANELASNPGLARAILYRFVDTNKDGTLSTRELLATPDDSNDIY